MSLSRDEVYRLMAIARGDIPASTKQRLAAQGQYDDLLEHWTRQLQRAESGNLTIIRESVERRLRRPIKVTVGNTIRLLRGGDSKTQSRAIAVPVKWLLPLAGRTS